MKVPKFGKKKESCERLCCESAKSELSTVFAHLVPRAGIWIRRSADRMDGAGRSLVAFSPISAHLSPVHYMSTRRRQKGSTWKSYRDRLGLRPRLRLHCRRSAVRGVGSGACPSRQPAWATPPRATSSRPAAREHWETTRCTESVCVEGRADVAGYPKVSNSGVTKRVTGVFVSSECL